MSIKGDTIELQKLDMEIKRLNKQINELRKKRNLLKSNIDQYLESKQLPGVKCGNVAIIREEKEKYSSKGIKKSDKEELAISLLKERGITNAKEVYKELQDTLKGEKVIESTIKLKNIN